MPDAFGQETPQEASARVRNTFRKHELQQMERGVQNTSGGRAGLALGQLFGGIGKQLLDTRKDRKSEAVRLAEELGLSANDARMFAKKNIPLGHSEVRQSKKLQTLSKDAIEHTDALKQSGVNPVMAQVSGMFMLASKLRANGFATEASQMSQQAIQMQQGEEQRLAEMDNLLARTDSSRASAASSRASARQAGETNFTKLVNKVEELQGMIDNSDDPRVIARLERMQGKIDAQISKLNTVVGTTENDPSALSRAGKNKQATEIIENKVLLSSLAMLEDDLIAQEGDYAFSFWGRATSRTLGIMEHYFERTPTEGEQEFIQRVKDTNGGLAFIAADIRHALTGAAMSPAEAVFLEPFLPLPSDSRTEALAKTRLLIRYTKEDVRIRQELLDSDRGTQERYMNSLKAQEAEIMHNMEETKALDKTLTDTGIPASDLGYNDADLQRAINALDLPDGQ